MTAEFANEFQPVWVKKEQELEIADIKKEIEETASPVRETDSNWDIGMPGYSSEMGTATCQVDQEEAPRMNEELSGNGCREDLIGIQIKEEIDIEDHNVEFEAPRMNEELSRNVCREDQVGIQIKEEVDIEDHNVEFVSTEHHNMEGFVGDVEDSFKEGAVEVQIEVEEDSIDFTNSGICGMGKFTWEEMSDMHLAYGKADGNGRGAGRLYEERYPTRRQPHHTTFGSIDRRLRETGMFRWSTHDSGRGKSAQSLHIEELVEDEPYANLNQRGMHTIRASVSGDLQEHHLDNSSYYESLEPSSPADYRKRKKFCKWFLRQSKVDPNFLNSVLFTDEALFTKYDIFNNHNMHKWHEDAQHVTRQRANQPRFSIYVWCGIVEDRLIGPYILPPHVTKSEYQVFLEKTLPELLENVPLSIRSGLWFMHTGISHFNVNVRHHLHTSYREHWIGKDGPIEWPAHSCDLNPLDFFLWKYLKSLVYESPVENESDLLHRILTTCNKIQRTPDILEHMQKSLIRRFQLCKEVEGRQFDQLL